MQRIFTIAQAADMAKTVRTEGKSLVVAGGCFDILHIGHIRFLDAARTQGDALMVFLESDEKIRETKGEGRPIHTQKERAEVLAALRSVDFVVVLPNFKADSDYDNLLSRTKPAIIATTKGDRYRMHKDRQAGQINAKVEEVIEFLPEYSTSSIAEKRVRNE